MSRNGRDVYLDLYALRAKHKGNRHKVAIPNYKTDAGAPSLGSGFAKGGFRKDPLAHKWKKGAEEHPDTVKEIERKAKRIAPAFNKGAAQYITDGDDPKYLGRK